MRTHPAAEPHKHAIDLPVDLADWLNSELILTGTQAALLASHWPEALPAAWADPRLRSVREHTRFVVEAAAAAAQRGYGAAA